MFSTNVWPMVHARQLCLERKKYRINFPCSRYEIIEIYWINSWFTLCCLRRQIRRKNLRKKRVANISSYYDWFMWNVFAIDSCIIIIFFLEFFSAFHAWLDFEFHMNHVRVKDANFVYIVCNWRDWLPLPACLPVGANPNIFHVRGGRRNWIVSCEWFFFSRWARERHTNVTWHDWPFLQRR